MYSNSRGFSRDVENLDVNSVSFLLVKKRLSYIRCFMYPTLHQVLFYE